MKFFKKTNDGRIVIPFYGTVRKILSNKLYSALLVLFIASLAVVVLCLIPPVAELYSRTVGTATRWLLANITGILPFSLAELLAYLLAVIFVVSIFCVIMMMITKKEEYGDFIVKTERGIFIAIVLFLIINNFAFLPCTKRYSVARNMGLERKPVTAQQLYECMQRINNELNECLESGDIRYDAEYSSCLPYSYSELSDKLNEIYASSHKKHKFLSLIKAPVKKIALSDIMTYTHISGVYTPMTGEANINTNYPDYTVAFSMAHEMAHQRGISREDEASFIACVTMYESDDNFLKYCALRELFGSVANALYEADEELLYNVYAETDIRIIREEYSFSMFFDKYRDSAASNVTSALNDTAIKLRGDKNGEKSYNMVVDLAVAYFGL